MAKMDFIFTFKRITNIYHHLTHKTSSQIKLQKAMQEEGVFIAQRNFMRDTVDIQ